MKSLVFGLLACWICVVPAAHAISGDQGPSSRTNQSVGARTSSVGQLAGPSQEPSSKAPLSTRKQLSLDETAQASQSTSPTMETITSLANGSSPINPWFPERGSIGVRVKVTW